MSHEFTKEVKRRVLRNILLCYCGKPTYQLLLTSPHLTSRLVNLQSRNGWSYNRLFTEALSGKFNSL
jgi:hypothetical protein